MKLASSVGLSTHVNLSFFHSAFQSFVECPNPPYPVALFRHLLHCQVKPNHLTFSLLIKACVSVFHSSNAELEASQLHSHLLKLGVDRFVYVGTAFMDFFMKLGCVETARNLFDDFPERDIVSWNAVICGYSRNGYDCNAFECFVRMRREGFAPLPTTLVSLIPSCSRHEFFVQGKSVHGVGIKDGLDLDCQVRNAFTSMYAKCADLRSANCLFRKTEEKSVVSWNTMIGAYGQNGLYEDAMHIFKEMLENCVGANSVTLVCLLSATAEPEPVHCHAIKTGIVKTEPVVTSLVCAYAKYRNIRSAEFLYRSETQKNMVSLTAIISYYAEKGDVGMVMDYVCQMQKSDMKLDAVALVCILQCIVNPEYIVIGLVLHCFGLKSGLTFDCLVANGLISMYLKFDDIKSAFSLFSKMHLKPLISWNSMISGCVQAGRSADAMDLFLQMKTFGHTPDAITLASLLSGCCQLGNLHFGEKLHCFILRHNIEFEDFVGSALIDMYIKCGRVSSAEKVFDSTKDPCLATWNTIISGYSVYGFESKALDCYESMVERGLKPDKITFLAVLSACVHRGLVAKGRKVFHIMKEEFNVMPGLQHCACIVGLLGRAGLLEEAIEFIKSMETKPDSAVWGALLSACCIHREIKLGECAARKLLFLDYRNGGLFVMMSNLYASAGRWDDVARVREMMGETGGNGCSGVSIIETSFS